MQGCFKCSWWKKGSYISLSAPNYKKCISSAKNDWANRYWVDSNVNYGQLDWLFEKTLRLYRKIKTGPQLWPQ